MSNIQHIPHDGKRVETGAVQFGDDWPGVFIRGDEALFYAAYLRSILNKHDFSISEKVHIRNLIKTLESCKLNTTEPKP